MCPEGARVGLAAGELLNIETTDANLFLLITLLPLKLLYLTKGGVGVIIVLTK
jgi:hypothetical protein